MLITGVLGAACSIRVRGGRARLTLEMVKVVSCDSDSVVVGTGGCGSGRSKAGIGRRRKEPDPLREIREVTSRGARTRMNASTLFCDF